MAKKLRFLFTLLFVMAATLSWGETEKITFSEKGYKNAQGFGGVTINASYFSISFAKGTNNNEPKYYDTGSAIRIYGGNTFTVSSDKLITNIALTFASGGNNNKLSTDVGSYGDNSWSGSSKNITFTVSGTTGNLRFASIEVTFSSSGDTPTVSAPTFTPAAGEVDYGTTVTLTQNDAEMIMYTVDGTDPSYANNNGEVYENPIEITAATTIKAIAVDADENESSVATAAYTIKKPNAPTFTPAAGTVNAGTEVTLSADAENIYYTLDGSTPTSSSTPYTNAITVNETTTIKAIAVDGGGNASEIAEATYIVIPAGAEEVTLWSEDFSSYNANNVPSGGTFNYSCSGTGTKIYAAILAGGVSPELLVAKSGGTFTAVVPLKKVVGDLTLTYKTNANSLNVSSTTEGITGSITSSTVGTHSVTFKGITASTTSITIVFKATSGNNVRLDDIVLTGLQMPNAVSTPVISPAGGTFFGPQSVEISCATEGATIKYSTDGENWKDYSSPIAIEQTTTLYAKAEKDGESSSVASATYTFPTVYTLGEMNTKVDGTYNVKFDNAVVIYVKDKYAFIEDASGAIMFYNDSNPYTAKQKLNGIASVVWKLYSGQPEATAITAIEGAEFSTDGSVENVEPVVVTLADLSGEYKDSFISRYVKVEGVSASEVSYTEKDGVKSYSASLTKDGTAIAFYGRNNTAVEEGGKYNITGFLGVYQPKNGDKTYQLVAYNTDQVEEIPVFAQIGETKYETLQAAVDAATEEQIVKVIKGGEYTLPGIAKNITIEGAVDGVVFKDIPSNPTGENNIASIPNGATFKNIVLELGNINYHGFTHAGTINMEECTINGKLFSYGDMNFTNCQFVQTTEGSESKGDYNMWVYSGNVVYDQCTFTNTFAGKLLHLYCEDVNLKHNVTVKDCKFINQGKESKAAINVKATSTNGALQYELHLEGNNTYEGNFPTAVGEQDNADKTWILSPLAQVDDRKISPDKITVTENGVLIYPATVAAIGETRYPTLQSAVDAAQQMGGEVTINIIDNISEETVTIQEVANFKLTIDGKKDENSNYTVDAVIVVDGLRANGGSTTNGASVTLQNIAFVKTTSTDGIQASHYPHDLTIQDCTYSGSDNDKWFLNASVDGPLYGVTVKNVTVEHARLIYANMAEDAVFQDITATTDCKVGFNVKTSGTALIENCQVTTAKYAFRDYSDGYVGTFTLKDNTFISTSTGSDEGAIVNRGGAVGTTHINVVSGNYSGKILVLNNKEGILAISGGIFSERVADEYCAEGYICAANPDTKTNEAYPYIVKEGQYTAQVGNEKFETFAEAVAAITEENNVITLLADVTETYTLTAGQTLNVNLNGFNLTVNAPEDYLLKTTEADGVTTYTTEAIPVVIPTAPVVFHDSGEYEAGLSVPMYAQAGAKIYYTTDGSEPTTASTEYNGALKIENATTLKAIAVLDGVSSAVVTRVYTIADAAEKVTAFDGYYSIKNGTGKYINVAGRKTVTFTDAIDDKAGTVIKVKTNDKGQVEVLRSQGVDLPGYAKKAMNYVPEIVELVVNKLHAADSGEILGPNGFKKIMDKFNESFDYNLYLEKAGEGYRIYGKTPSMKPVVDFYAENKADVDFKLPQLEDFINKAIKKVLEKTNGHGASILTEFKLHDIWQNMGGTLTEPVKNDAASIAKFYEEVLSSEANVWNFAYQTAMIYWGNVKNHPRYEELKGKLGEYAKYIEKVENIRPNFKYYIVANEAGNDVDFISEGNTDINAARATWTLEPRTDFKVTFDPENVKNGGTEYYATLYTDFGYKLAEGMKAYKVAAVDDKGYAKLEEIKATQIPAQTPVLLMTTDLTKTTVEVADGGEKITGENLLVGPDYLINEYQIKTAQVEGLFDTAKDIMGESFYANYVKEYEHLMMRNAGTVNNKYFFGLGAADVEKCVYGSDNECVVRNLSNGEEKLGFYGNWKVEANKAFIVSETFNPVKLTKIPDVNRDGKIDVNDVTATVDIILGKDSAVPYKFDHDAADVNNSNSIDVNDVTGIVDIVLGKKTIE